MVRRTTASSEVRMSNELATQKDRRVSWSDIHDMVRHLRVSASRQSSSAQTVDCATSVNDLRSAGTWWQRKLSHCEKTWEFLSFIHYSPNTQSQALRCMSFKWRAHHRHRHHTMFTMLQNDLCVRPSVRHRLTHLLPTNCTVLAGTQWPAGPAALQRSRQRRGVH